MLDGVGLRLPDDLHPAGGRRTGPASGFFSNILREPLAGREAVLPVPDTVRHWHASPRAAIGFLLHAATMDTGPLGQARTLSLPGLSATVAEQIEALRRVAGEGAVRLIRTELDAGIGRIVAGWPQAFDPQRALQLGFRGDESFEAIIRTHLEDERVWGSCAELSLVAARRGGLPANTVRERRALAGQSGGRPGLRGIGLRAIGLRGSGCGKRPWGRVLPDGCHDL